VGRYFAMDRDNRWERVRKAYDVMVKGIGEQFLSASEALQISYAKNITDEFIEPVVVSQEGTIANGDVVISFNFRTDRPREISIALTQKEFPEFDMKPLGLSYFTMTNYDRTFNNINVIFEKENLNQTLGE